MRPAMFRRKSGLRPGWQGWGWGTPRDPDSARWRPEDDQEANVSDMGFGRRNVHCSNCGDERGGPFGHETSECRYRPGMTAEEVAALLPAARRGEFWDQQIDRYFRKRGVL
jgi:hypothetical protein